MTRSENMDADLLEKLEKKRRDVEGVPTEDLIAELRTTATKWSRGLLEPWSATYMRDAADRLESQDAEIRHLRSELEEAEATLDLQHQASVRAGERWREAHPDREHIWPDLTDLLVWLVTTVDEQSAELERRDAALREARADAERLDWLEEYASKVRRHHPKGRVSIRTHRSGNMLPGEPTVREAIDAARAHHE